MVDDAATRPLAQSPGAGGYGLLRTLIVTAALPFVAVTLLERWGVAAAPAVAMAAIFPAGSVLYSFLAARRLEIIGIASLVTMFGAVAVALASDDARFGIMKAAPAFGLFGIACLASLPRARPLMFYVSRHFVAGADPAKSTAWDARMATAGFRSSMRLLTLVWGVAALVESALGMAAALLLPTGLALVVEPAVALGTVAALLAWTTAYVRRREAAAARDRTDG